MKNVIYGAGVIGKIVLQNCRERGIVVDCFCDDSISKIGTTIDNIPVLHPNNIDKTSAHFIVTIFDIMRYRDLQIKQQ